MRTLALIATLGADDPAFRQPFERALQSDAPQALRDLHAAAKAGNTAALLALPTGSGWLRGTLPFADRKALSHVNGVPLAEAVTAADPTAALWNMGDRGTDPASQLQSSFGLYAAGEDDKATLQFLG